MWVPSHIGITKNEMADKAANLATKIIPIQQFLTYQLTTSNHPSNTKYIPDGKIIGILFHPPINLKQLRKTQKNGSPLTTSADGRKLPSQHAESDLPLKPIHISLTKIRHLFVINTIIAFQFNTYFFARSNGT